MPPIPLSPAKESLLDLLNILHHATTLELRLRKAEEWAETIETNLNGDGGLGYDSDSEEFKVDTGPITEEKDIKSIEIRRFREELEVVLNTLQDQPSQGFSGLSAEDTDLALSYGQTLITWVQNLRKYLFDILARAQISSQEKEERKDEFQTVQDLLGQIDALRTFAMKIQRRLDGVARSANETTQIGSGTAGSEPDLTEILQRTKVDLQDFSRLRQTYSDNANSLHDQTVQTLQWVPPIVPARNVEIDPIVIRQIVMEESNILYGKFRSSLTEEIRKNGLGESSMTKMMADVNKVVCKLLVASLGCDELGVLDEDWRQD